MVSKLIDRKVICWYVINNQKFLCMNNYSQDIYQTVRTTFAEMMKVNLVNVKFNKVVPHWKREGFAKLLEQKFDIVFTTPDDLPRLSDWAEYIKKRERSCRIPIIEDIVRTQVLIFAPKSQADDQPYFANFPDNWKKNIIKPIQNRLYELFKTPWYSAGKGVYPFDHDFTFNELIEWIYKNEQIK